MATMKTRTSLRAQIEKSNRVFEKAKTPDDAKRIAEQYTEDAALLPAGAETVRGRKAIRRFWEEMIEANPMSIQLATDEVEQFGDYAYEVGSYAMPGGDGEPGDVGKYLVVWKREAGTWRLHRDIWNSDTEPPAA